MTVRERLFALRDLPYRDFLCPLIPTVPAETVLGVRTPALRALAKELRDTPEAAAFLAELPHTYYEENNLVKVLDSDNDLIQYEYDQDGDIKK